MDAIIDIGSNSVLLLIAQRDASGAVRCVLDLATVTRLSQGAAQSGKLQPEAIERTLSCLRRYAQIAVDHECERVEAVATEGVRMASNREAFLEPARGALGREVRLIAGQEEARLSYLSVAMEERSPDDRRPLAVLDIGGGSTELAIGVGRTLLHSASHRIGSVRLTERHVRHDPPRQDEIDAIEADCRAAFATQTVEPLEELHGLAGTVTTTAALLLGLSAYDRERVDGQRFARDQVRGLRDALAAQTVAQREALACLGPGRADVAVAGITILCAALEHCGASTLVVRDRGLRWALVGAADSM